MNFHRLWWIAIVILAVLVVLLSLSFFANRDKQSQIDKMQYKLHVADTAILYYQSKNADLRIQIGGLVQRDSMLSTQLEIQDKRLENVHKYYNRKLASFDSTTTINELQQFFEARYSAR